MHPYLRPDCDVRTMSAREGIPEREGAEAGNTEVRGFHPSALHRLEHTDAPAFSLHSPCRVCRWRQLLGGTDSILARAGATGTLRTGLIGPSGSLALSSASTACECEREGGGVPPPRIIRAGELPHGDPVAERFISVCRRP